MTPADKLLRMSGGPTRYELAAINGDQRVLIAYSARQGRHALLTTAQKHGQTLIDLMQLSSDAQLVFLKPASLGAQIGAWSIRFTGRTQRDAIYNGELPFIGALKP